MYYYQGLIIICHVFRYRLHYNYLVSSHYCCEDVLTPKKVPSDSLVKMTLWTFVETHITNIEMKHDVLMKIADTHSLFGPIWQIFLPVYHRPSKRASCFISILENLASTKVHRAIFISEMLGTFFWCQHRLAIAVCNFDMST